MYSPNFYATVMDKLLCGAEAGVPVVDHTKTLTEYVPEGTLTTTYAVCDAPAPSVIVDVATSTVCPAELCNTAKTTPVAEDVSELVMDTQTAL
jgi:hypothetical protein